MFGPVDLSALRKPALCKLISFVMVVHPAHCGLELYPAGFAFPGDQFVGFSTGYAVSFVCDLSVLRAIQIFVHLSNSIVRHTVI